MTDGTNDQDDDLGEAMAAVKHLFMSRGADDENILRDAYALIHERWPDLDDVHQGFAVGCALGYFSGQNTILAQIGKPTWGDTAIPGWATKLPTAAA